MSESESLAGPAMLIVSWNINSLNVRLGHVLRYLDARRPDIVCLQETRLPEARFPRSAFAERGYHVATASTGTYAGVATLSRAPLETLAIGVEGAPEIVTATASRRLLCRVGTWFVDNVYVPTRTKIGKSEFLDALGADHRRRFDESSLVVLAGDFNICFDERDYASPRMITGADIHPNRPEDLAFRRLLAVGLTDCLRAKHDQRGLYTWFAPPAWTVKRNYGMRLDYVFASTSATRHLVDVEHDAEPRTWDRPSDHLPVAARFRIPAG
jgi:exodeoxyribonuclease III